MGPGFPLLPSLSQSLALHRSEILGQARHEQAVEDPGPAEYEGKDLSETILVRTEEQVFGRAAEGPRLRWRDEGISLGGGEVKISW